MSGDIRALIQQSHACYDVQPYYILLEDRPIGVAATIRRIQAGFDIDLYGLKNRDEAGYSPEYSLACAALQDAIERASHNLGECCTIELIPLASDTIYISGEGKGLRPWGTVRIRVAHARGLDKPAGESEQHALKEIQAQLESLGIKAGKAR